VPKTINKIQVFIIGLRPTLSPFLGHHRYHNQGSIQPRRKRMQWSIRRTYNWTCSLMLHLRNSQQPILSTRWRNRWKTTNLRLGAYNS